MKTDANQSFTPLALETRPAIPTEAAAYYLNRRPQTLRAWACLENGPIRPIRINGRLAWSVAEIKSLLRGDAITSKAQSIAKEKSGVLP